MSRHSPGPLQELHLGVVLDNDDPDDRGRVKLHLAATGLETWAAVMVPSAGGGYGVSLLPRVGEQVVVAFVAPDLPIVLGAVWSGGASQPEDARPVDERYLVQSPAGLKVLLDDRQPSVTIETPAGNRLVITDQGGGKVTIEQGGERVDIAPGTVKLTGSVSQDGVLSAQSTAGPPSPGCTTSTSRASIQAASSPVARRCAQSICADHSSP